MKTRSTVLFASLVGISIALAGCASAPQPDTAGQSVAAADDLSIVDPWVKSAEEGMSAAFGVLQNSSAEDITVTSVTSAAATELQLHETVSNDSGEMVMQEKDGGFVIPAGRSLVLEPGGNHIMLMELTAPLVAGDEVTFTVALADGSTFDFTAPVKDFSGAKEEYVDEEMDMGH